MLGSDEPRRPIEPPRLDIFKAKLSSAVNHESVPVEFLASILNDVRMQEGLNPEWRAHREFLEDLLKERGVSI